MQTEEMYTLNMYQNISIVDYFVREHLVRLFLGETSRKQTLHYELNFIAIIEYLPLIPYNNSIICGINININITRLDY